jgi:hypothetical protein
MTPKESRDKIYDAVMRLLEQSLELLSVFKEASRDLIIIFLFHKAA